MPLRLDFVPMVRILIQLFLLAESQRMSCGGALTQLTVAVIVEIAEGAAARGGGSRNSGAGVERDVFEVAVAQIAIEKFALRVTGFRGELLDLGIDVAIADEDVGPTVVVKIEKAAAPAKILRVLAKTSLERGVFKYGCAEIAIKRRRIAGEICFDDVEVAIHVVIGGGNAHAGLRLAVGT